MPGSLHMVGTLASVAALMVWHTTTVEGHAFQMKPISRQFSRTREFNNGDVHFVEKHADAYNGGGPHVVKERQYERTDPDVLERYGGGEIWPPAAAWDLGEIMPNGNYYESDEMGVSHGICGDTPQSQNDADITYSTPNKDWDVLASYEGGSIIDMDVVVTNHHFGHLEFFVCCSADLDDPEGVVTQACFNKHPLDRAEDDSFNSPVDPSYPGRYFIDPPCRVDETDQTRPFLGGGVLDNGVVNHMRYKLPEITCDHAVLQMRYHSGRGCRSPGYDEFNPTDWGSKCAPNKEDWIAVNGARCRKPGKYGNVFWQCSDIELTGDFSEGDSIDSEASSSTTEVVMDSLDF